MSKKTTKPRAEQIIEAASEELVRAWLILIHAGENLNDFTNKGEVVFTGDNGNQLGVNFSVKLIIKKAEILTETSPALAANKKPGATNTGPAPKTQKGRRA